MSLIERAIDKLGPASVPSGPAPSSAPTAGLEGTIERAMAQVSGLETRRFASASSTPPDPAHVDAHAAANAWPAPNPAQPSYCIDLGALRARGFVVPDSARSPVGNEFRVIKRPLLAKAFGRGGDAVDNGRRVMMTSALPGEGKSFCAINLAMSIAAERDHKVLLVDADVARPSIPRELGIETGPGLMDWLIDGSIDLDQLVRPTNVDKLSLLSAGRRHEHATELLASDAMTHLLERLSTRYPDTLIIFDSPPLLVTTESRVLASYMGQVVMVVEAGRTPRDAVKDAIATIGRPEIVGLLFNKSALGSGSSPYGYQGYGNGER